MTAEETRLACANEAISSLGYVVPDAAGTIAVLMTFCDVHHPRQVAAKYRKLGDQISREEKRALGIRANGFLSIGALAELTEKGRQAPLHAHYMTLLRATFSHTRLRMIASPPPHEHASLRYDAMFSDCAGCSRLHETSLEAASASPFPPEDCEREGCAIMLRWEVDHFAVIVERERQKRRV